MGSNRVLGRHAEMSMKSLNKSYMPNLSKSFIIIIFSFYFSKATLLPSKYQENYKGYS
jgi:hypothetical protein